MVKLGIRAFPAGGFRELHASVRMVLVDVMENPNSTITQIVERTGFPQSHVSASVARLRNSGVLITKVDPADRRRTVVAPSPEHLQRIEISKRDLEPIDSVVKAALVEAGTYSADHLREAMASLATLARLLTPSAVSAPSAPGVEQLSDALPTATSVKKPVEKSVEKPVAKRPRSKGQR